MGRFAARISTAATVRNRAKLAYNSVADWLEGEGPAPDPIAAVEGLAENLRLQDRAAQRLKAFRHEHGALDLETIEARPVFDGDVIRDLEAERRNRAKDLIEDFMIAANGVTARYLKARKVSLPAARGPLPQAMGTDRRSGLPVRRNASAGARSEGARPVSGGKEGRRPSPLSRSFPYHHQADGGRRIRGRISGGDVSRSFRARGKGLHPLHGPEPAISRSHNPTAAQGLPSRARRYRTIATN